ncbi:MAG: nitroreductase family protein [Methanomassiliicoccales archaeon]|jgi:nitroreductase
MDEGKLYETIFERKSVRKYESASLDQGTMEKVRSQMVSLKPLVPDIKTEFRILTNEEVKGMPKVDAPHFLAIYSEEKEGFAANAGYMMQQMDLYFNASGIGSCYQGNPKPTKKVEAPVGLEFVIMMAFGKPTGELKRKRVTEFKRRALSEISDIKGMDELLEPVRLAPSGVNNQPWYYRGDENRIDAYQAKSMMFDQMNQISVGIGMCHLWLSALHHKRMIDPVIENPGDDRTPKGYRYVVSAKMK